MRIASRFFLTGFAASLASLMLGGCGGRAVGPADSAIVPAAGARAGVHPAINGALRIVDQANFWIYPSDQTPNGCSWWADSHLFPLRPNRSEVFYLSHDNQCALHDDVWRVTFAPRNRRDSNCTLEAAAEHFDDYSYVIVNQRHAACVIQYITVGSRAWEQLNYVARK